MRFKPHPYQTQAINFLQTNPHAALFLGMGLGKTVITLTALKQLHYDFAYNRALIIAPLRVARDTWPAEIHKWEHLQNLTWSSAVGTPQQRTKALAAKTDLTFINRENLPWLVKNHPWQWDLVVIDELSSFKNHKAQRFKALKAVRPKIHRIIGLTGTPASNGLLDLWAQFRLLDQGERLGRFITRYRDQYFEPDKRNQNLIYSYKPRPGAEENIYQAISDITLSMKTNAYLKLPALTKVTVPIRLNRAQQAEYDRFRRDLILELDGEEITAANAATLTGKLTQYASGAIYTPNGETKPLHERKLDALEDLIEAANGQPLLVAYWFKHERDRILKRFPQAIDLKTAQDFKNWNHKHIPVGLIHPASAGHGLNLQQGGSRFVWFTVPWSLELYAQANARLYRQGQTEPVTIHHLIVEQTMDERILKVLQAKHETEDALLEAVKAELKGVKL